MRISEKQAESYLPPQITTIELLCEGSVFAVSNEKLEKTYGEW